MSDNFDLDLIEEQGDLTPASQTVLSTLSRRIARANRPITPVNVRASEITFISVLVDNSISMSPHQRAVIDGCNLMAEALQGAKRKNAMEIQLSVLNGFAGNQGIVYDYTPVTGVQPLGSNGIVILDYTPLYDQTVAVFGEIARKCAIAEDQGMSVRSQTLIFTDGEDTDSRAHSAADCNTLIGDMLRTEKHRALFCGVGSEANFRAIAKSMGFWDDCVTVIPATAKAFRALFQEFSQSADSFSQAAGDDLGAAAAQGFSVQLGDDGDDD